MASIIAVWAILWLGIAVVVTVTLLRRRRPLVAAAWLISIGELAPAPDETGQFSRDVVQAALGARGAHLSLLAPGLPASASPPSSRSASGS